MHAGGSVHENGHNAELFSPAADNSTFHGLGLAQALSEHLEGARSLQTVTTYLADGHSIYIADSTYNLVVCLQR